MSLQKALQNGNVKKRRENTHTNTVWFIHAGWSPSQSDGAFLQLSYGFEIHTTTLPVGAEKFALKTAVLPWHPHSNGCLEANVENGTLKKRHTYTVWFTRRIISFTIGWSFLTVSLNCRHTAVFLKECRRKQRFYQFCYSGVLKKKYWRWTQPKK